MKALLWTAPERMEMVERDTPEPGEGELLISVQYAGICGSELEGYLGHNSLRVPPLLMGHEFSGIVQAIGRNVAGWRLGERVAVNPLQYCGQCPRCINGMTMLCDRRSIVGIHRPGAFAEFVAVPAGNVHRIPDQLSSRTAAISEPLACAWRASRRAVQEHTLPNVVIIGAGAIGILCAFCCRKLGASNIWMIENNVTRHPMIRSLGFEALEPGEGLEEEIEERAGTRGIDVVIDAAGFQPTRELSMRLLNAGGTFMNIGLGIDQTQLPINQLIRNEITIKGSFCYSDKDFKDALTLLEQGWISEAGWTSLRRLEEGAESFRALTRGEVKEAKIILAIREEEKSGQTG